MKGRILGLISAALFVIATLTVSTASLIWWYQPKAPKFLQK
ncbi:MAG: cyclic lactone autoinducer peptide [Clostridiaceae bacterium]|nr:cyclic lactone autoinducer peptide [Clostridiaceae bacterium]